MIAFVKKKLIPLIVLLVVGVGLFAAPVQAEAGFWSVLFDSAAGETVTKIVDSSFGALFSATSSLINQVSGWLLGSAGLVFDYAILESLDSSYLNQSYIKDGWTFARNIANTFFIFVILIIAIATILRYEEYGAKRLLAKLIIIALLVNFSFALTRVVIDASNVVAVGFYNGAIGKTATSNKYSNQSITSQLVANLKLASILEVSNDSSVEPTEFSNTNDAITFLLGSGLMLVTSLVFLGGAILFVIRTIIFAFLIILSPLAFLAAVLPGTQQYFGQWSRHLFNQAFFAPIYLFMIAIVLDISKAGRDALGNIAYTSTLGDTAGNYDISNFKIIFHFVLMTGFIVGAMVVSKSMAGAAGSTAVAFGKKWGKKAGRNTAAFAGRQGPGRLFAALSRSEKLKSWAGGKNGEDPSRLGRVVGGAVLKSSDYVAGSSFGGAKGGFKSVIEKQEKRQDKFNELLGGGAAGTERQRAYMNRLEQRKGPLTATGMAAGKTAGKIKKTLDKEDAKEKLKNKRETRLTEIEKDITSYESQKKDIEEQIRAGGIGTDVNKLQDNLSKINKQISDINKEAEGIRVNIENAGALGELEGRVSKNEEKVKGGGSPKPETEKKETT